jgi:hypothetical protein
MDLSMISAQSFLFVMYSHQVTKSVPWHCVSRTGPLKESVTVLLSLLFMMYSHMVAKNVLRQLCLCIFAPFPRIA